MRSLYHYQEEAIDTLFGKLQECPFEHRLLYQLPTGGGKTLIFSEIVKRFLKHYNKKVMVLTHRVELCNQTLATLKKQGIKSRVINSSVKKLGQREKYCCYVAMVETVKNRIKDGIIDTKEIGLVIIDEAHHNSFRKLLDKFENAAIIGVTATPLSSDVNLPMNRNYHELVMGESISSLIEQGFLARPTTWRYDVELNTLKTSPHGDFNISTSDELYSSQAMLDLLAHAYEAHSRGKKTLIFNNGIFTSKNVCKLFSDLGYPIKHLDNNTPAAERTAILKWLMNTRGAILTSVSLLTTGFDEPSVQTVILNRATNSLTLYHQMIGRGSRRLPQKKNFTIIDLGNNAERFGDWQTPVDWPMIFEHPEAYYESVNISDNAEVHHIPSELRSKFPKSLEISFDVQQAFHDALSKGQKPKIVIRDSLRQHIRMCVENSETLIEGLELAGLLNKEIDWRIKQYSKCVGKVTKNYTEWLQADYKTKLKSFVQKLLHRHELQEIAV